MAIGKNLISLAAVLFGMQAIPAMAQDNLIDVNGYIDFNSQWNHVETNKFGLPYTTNDEAAQSFGIGLQVGNDTCAIGILPVFTRRNDQASPTTGFFIGDGFIQLTRFSGEVGCRVSRDFRMLGMVSVSRQSSLYPGHNEMFETTKMGALGFDWQANDDLNLAVMVGHQIDYGQHVFATYNNQVTAKADYFFNDNLMLEAKAGYFGWQWGSQVNAAANLFYKPDDWRTAFYAGVNAEYHSFNNNLAPDDNGTNFGAMAGIRVYFGDGSLRQKQHDLLPVF